MLLLSTSASSSLWRPTTTTTTPTTTGCRALVGFTQVDAEKTNKRQAASWWVSGDWLAKKCTARMPPGKLISYLLASIYNTHTRNERTNERTNEREKDSQAEIRLTDFILNPKLLHHSWTLNRWITCSSSSSSYQETVSTFFSLSFSQTQTGSGYHFGWIMLL